MYELGFLNAVNVCTGYPVTLRLMAAEEGGRRGVMFERQKSKLLAHEGLLE